MNMFTGEAAKEYAKKREQEEKENTFYSETWDVRICNFNSLKKALENSIIPVLKKLRSYAKNEGLSDLQDLCQLILKPTPKTEKLIEWELPEFEFEPESQARFEEYYATIPFQYAFVTYHIEPFSTRLLISAHRDLIFRTAALLPTILDADLWTEKTTAHAIEQADYLLGKTQMLVEIWDGVHQGIHSTTGSGSPFFNGFEKAILQLLDFHNNGKRKGARSTHKLNEGLREKILSRAKEIDLEKTRSANSLANLLAEEFQDTEIVVIQTLKDGRKLTARGQKSPDGLTKSNIYRILREAGWQ